FVTIYLPGKAHQPGVLYSFSFLSYNKGSNWSDICSFGLITSENKTVGHPLVAAFGLGRLNYS
ncbi:MAG: hypothetical protein IJB70_03130, partial [Clostridia bacterium]|nr:hypothetical protein [Clostridia bacterium]